MVSVNKAQPRVRRRVNVLGWYGRNNIGDESFKIALASLFPDLDFNFITEKPDDALPTILGGGDVVKEFYLKQIEQPFVAVGVGLGYPSEMDLLFQDGLCRGAWFRNDADYSAAFKLNRANAYVCPDLAFAIPPPPKVDPKPVAKDGKKRLAVILANSAVNPKMGTSGFAETHYQEYMRWEIAKALDVLKEWYEIHFLPMSHERFAYDEVAHFEVISRMTTAHMLHPWQWSNTHPIEFMRKISGFDLVISMKYHGLIFSTIMGVPFVNIGLTRKTQLLCEDLGQQGRYACMDPYTLTADRLLETVKRVEELQSPDALLFKAQRFRNQWKTIADEIRSALFPEQPGLDDSASLVEKPAPIAHKDLDKPLA
jgi:polysaccharide pyruvyl transferase WcaK-like protein